MSKKVFDAEVPVYNSTFRNSGFTEEFSTKTPTAS